MCIHVCVYIYIYIYILCGARKSSGGRSWPFSAVVFSELIIMIIIMIMIILRDDGDDDPRLSGWCFLNSPLVMCLQLCVSVLCIYIYIYIVLCVCFIRSL